jgi:hypothetical protein
MKWAMGNVQLTIVHCVDAFSVIDAKSQACVGAVLMSNYPVANCSGQHSAVRGRQ